MINRTMLSAALVAGMAIAPFVLAQVQPVTPGAVQDELDVNTGEQDDPRMMDERGGGHPGMMGGPQRGIMF